MTLSQWFIFFLAIQLIHGLGTWKLYIWCYFYENPEPTNLVGFIVIFTSDQLNYVNYHMGGNRPKFWQKYNNRHYFINCHFRVL
jgi:hypothetical protein